MKALLSLLVAVGLMLGMCAPSNAGLLGGGGGGGILSKLKEKMGGGGGGEGGNCENGQCQNCENGQCETVERGPRMELRGRETVTRNDNRQTFLPARNEEEGINPAILFAICAPIGIVLLAGLGGGSYVITRKIQESRNSG